MKDTDQTKPVQKEIMYNSVGIFPWDPMGSYTGRPREPYEVPVQDADDL